MLQPIFFLNTYSIAKREKEHDAHHNIEAVIIMQTGNICEVHPINTRQKSQRHEYGR